MSNAPAVNVTIRTAELSDASALAPLMGELGYETTAAEMQRRLQSLLQDSRYKTFVAVCDEEICGMVGTGCYDSYEHNDPSGRILALVVSKTMRHHGVGRELIAAAEKDFAERNIKRVALNTRFERADAHKFYEAMGYSRNGFRFAKNL